MLPKLARFILSLATFPLIGAYGLRWLGGFIGQLISSTGFDARALVALDLVGAVVGLVLGIILVIRIMGCCVQPESVPVRPVGDNILIILGVTLVADVVIVRMFPQAEWLRWLPPANLIIWSGAAAATLSLHRMRDHYRAQPPMPPPDGGTGSPAAGTGS